MRAQSADPHVLYRHKSIEQRPCQYGLGTFATRAIPNGTVILREKPYVVGIDPVEPIYEPETRYVHIQQLLSNPDTHHKFLQMVPLEIDPNDPSVPAYSSEMREFHQKHLPDISPHEMRLYFTKYKRNVFKFGDEIGFLFYGTRMNHSCAPNVSYYKNGDHMIFQTTRDIAKNEEICDSYIHPQLPVSERKSILKERYGFDCQCIQCTNDINPSSDGMYIDNADI